MDLMVEFDRMRLHNPQKLIPERETYPPGTKVSKLQTLPSMGHCLVHPFPKLVTDGRHSDPRPTHAALIDKASYLVACNQQ